MLSLLIFLLICAAVSLTLAVREEPLKHWCFAILVLLVVMHAMFGFSGWHLILWLIGGFVALLNLEKFRKPAFTGPVFKIVKRILPTMSETERDALNAGTVWFDAELFSGKPDWSVIRDMKKSELSPREQAFIDGELNELCEMLDDWQIDQDKDMPTEVWDFIRDKKFLSMIIPKEFGGLEFSHQAQSEVVTRLATRSLAAGVSVMVPNSLGPGELLMKYGTQEQKDFYLPRLADGRELPCFGLTGPYAGSDAASMQDFGIVEKGMYEGKEIIGIRLNWEKRYITLGPKATVLGLAFKLEDPDNLLNRPNDMGITLALIPTDYPGVDIGRRHLPADQAFLNGPNSGKDVFIPMDFVIGGEARLGEGWKMLMNALAAGRAISLPASGTASAKAAAMLTTAYARIRQQFNIPIGLMEGVSEKLAEICALAYATESSRRMTNLALDEGHRPSVISALWKYEATERGRKAVEYAMDIHGGKAICGGPKNYLFNAFKAQPIGITVEGANILIRSLITFGQGAVRAHPWLQKEMAAVEMTDKDQALDAFDKAFMSHLGFVISNKGRTMVYNLSGGYLAPKVKGASKKATYWYQQLSRMSANYAYLVDIALATMGGSLKRKQKISGRYADALGELYLMSASVRRWEKDGAHKADQALLDYTMHRGMYNVQQAFDGILANLPIRPLAWALRWQIFPWGRRWRMPSDALGQALVKSVLAPTETRARMVEGIFVSSDPRDAVAELEQAFADSIEIQEAESKIRKAVRASKIEESDRPADQREKAFAAQVISAAEFKRLEDWEGTLRSIIDVDDFAYEELSPRLAKLQHNTGVRG